MSSYEILANLHDGRTLSISEYLSTGEGVGTAKFFYIYDGKGDILFHISNRLANSLTPKDKEVFFEEMSGHSVPVTSDLALTIRRLSLELLELARPIATRAYQAAEAKAAKITLEKK